MAIHITSPFNLARKGTVRLLWHPLSSRISCRLFDFYVCCNYIHEKEESLVSVSFCGSFRYAKILTCPLWEHRKFIQKFCKVKTINGLLLEHRYDYIYSENEELNNHFPFALRQSLSPNRFSVFLLTSLTNALN